MAEEAGVMQRIFVSGVQKELAVERRAVAAFVRGDPLLRRFFEVFLFEELPASDRRAEAAFLGEVRRCDLYVGIFGATAGAGRAGGRTPTEAEFDEATRTGKVRLVFVKGPKGTSRDERMEALIARASGSLVRRRFSGVAELRSALYASLVEHLERTGRVSTKPFDASPCLEATLSDLSKQRLEAFLARAKAERDFALGPRTPLRSALSHLELLDRGLPNHAAVLLFGKKPQRFLPTSEVKCLHFHGTEVAKPIPSYQLYRGTVFELIDQAADFVLSKLARWVGTRSASSAAPVRYELPPEAVREAIVNAVAHRDYADNASVQVMLFSDRLEVWNPGALPPALTLARLRRPHASIPRNPLIAGPLFLAGYAERAGTGILDMIARCRAAGLSEPSFRQDGGQFVQALIRPASTQQVAPQVAPQVTPELRLARAIMGEMTRAEIQSSLGLEDRMHFTKAYLQPALDAGLIEMTRPDKPTSWMQRYRLTAKGRRLKEAS